MIAQLNVSAAGWMVECDSCNVWYHGKCVNAKKSTIETTEQFMCPSCAHKTGIPYLFDRTPVCSLLPQNIRKASPKFCIHCLRLQVPIAQRPKPLQVLEWLHDAEELKVSLDSNRMVAAFGSWLQFASTGISAGDNRRGRVA